MGENRTGGKGSVVCFLPFPPNPAGLDDDKMASSGNGTGGPAAAEVTEWSLQCLQLYSTDQMEFYRVCVTLAFAYPEFLFAFIFETVVMGSLCCLGLAGNLISVVVLSHDRSRIGNGANWFLKSLCLADSAFLLLYLFYKSLRYIYPLTGHLSAYYHAFPFMVRYFWVFGMTVQMLVNWIIVLVTLERFTVVCRPFTASKWCGPAKAKLATTCLLCLAVLYNIPRFFEWSVQAVPSNPCWNYTRYQAVDSPLRQNAFFSICYRLILYSTIVAIGPVGLLIYMNVRLIRALKRARQDRIELTQRSPTSESLTASGGRHNSTCSPRRHHHHLRDRNRNITICIVALVTVFIVCETPALVHQILAAGNAHFDIRVQMYTVALSDALVIIKSSSNFIIYCLCGRKFRYILLRLMRRGAGGGSAGIGGGAGHRPRIPRGFVAMVRSLQERCRSIGGGGADNGEGEATMRLHNTADNTTGRRRKCIDMGRQEVL